jgi:nicotinate-nucleotide adenylyltransferase
MDEAMPEVVRRIALFGGSFDPPHTGHLAIARAAVAECALDSVIFIPCRESPLKGKLPGASGEQRLAMLKLATADCPWAEVSDWELRQPGPSYSWQTAEHFAAQEPQGIFHWLMGADQWAEIERWARPEYLRHQLTFIVFAREGVQPRRRADWKAVFLPGEYPGSSTEARCRIGAGESGGGLLSAAVEEYIVSARLYRSGDPQ